MSKRKDAVDDVADDFSEFSLSAPARKMRRLDADVPLFINQTEEESPMVFEDVDFEERSSVGYVPPSTKENMAIVLYHPTNTALESSVHSGVSFWVDSNLISGIKDENKKFWSNRGARISDIVEEEQASDDGGASRSGNGCLDLVPWLPSQIPDVDTLSGSEISTPEEQMDLGESTDAMVMDVDGEAGLERDPRRAVPMEVPYAPLGIEPFGGLQHWQQQHCMYPNVQSNTSAAVTWSW